MISKGKVVHVDDAVAGMVLSKAVIDDRGGVLLPTATVLTDSMLRSLQRRGIAMVSVVSNDISEAELKAERERVQQRLAILFRKSGADRACRVLLQRITEYKLGELE